MYRLFTLSVLFLSACAADEDRTAEGNPVNDVRLIDSTSQISGCYTAVLQKDTANFVIQHEHGAESISGDLDYVNYEKDANKGTVNGKISNGMIVGFYRYFSEGKESVRQVVFKIQGDTLLEGYGKLHQLSDTTFFENVEDLKFLTEKPFIKRNCE